MQECQVKQKKTSLSSEWSLGCCPYGGTNSLAVTSLVSSPFFYLPHIQQAAPASGPLHMLSLLSETTFLLLCLCWRLLVPLGSTPPSFTSSWRLPLMICHTCYSLSHHSTLFHSLFIFLYSLPVPHPKNVRPWGWKLGPRPLLHVSPGLRPESGVLSQMFEGAHRLPGYLLLFFFSRHCLTQWEHCR